MRLALLALVLVASAGCRTGSHQDQRPRTEVR
jgi:hypothetical protein